MTIQKNQLKSSSNNKNHQLKVELSKNNKKFQVAVLVNHTHVAEHVAMDGNGEKTDGEDGNPEFSLYGQWRLPLKHHPSNLFHFFFFFFFSFSLCQIPIQVLNFCLFLCQNYIKVLSISNSNGLVSLRVSSLLLSLFIYIYLLVLLWLTMIDWWM